VELLLQPDRVAAHAEAADEEQQADEDEELPVDPVPVGRGADRVRQADGIEKPMKTTSVVSLNSPMKVLTMPGIEIFSACGRMISRIDFQ
jgi:hypothetical protein